MENRIVNIGGAGDMATVASQRLLAMLPDCYITLADINVLRAEYNAKFLGGDRVEVKKVDLFNPQQLREVIRRCDLVVNSTGPYYRTGKPVLEACIKEKVNYIDFGDTDLAFNMLFELDEQVKNAEIVAATGCGVSPGVLSVAVRKCILELDQVEDIEVAWVTGPTPVKEGREKGGKAIIEHMIFETMSNTHCLRDGLPVEIPSFKIAKVIRFPQPLGDYKVYECGHAEVATYPRFIPGLKNLHVYGSCHPPYLNGLFRGVAKRVKSGTINMKDAVNFLFAVDAGETPKEIRPYLWMFEGVLSQLANGELRKGDLIKFLHELRGKREGHSIAALSVKVEGIKKQKRVRMETSFAGYQSGPRGVVDLDDVTGTPLAVFSYMILQGLVEDIGVLAPEAFVDPEEFMRIMEPLNVAGMKEVMDIKTTEI